MPQPNVYLPEGHRRVLEELAATERVSPEVILARAVEDYLARRREQEAGWAARFDRLIERLSATIPADLPEEEIAADVTAAIAESRRDRRAARPS